MITIRKTRGVWRCVVCGQASPDQQRPHLGDCRCATKRPGLGDRVAAVLERVGITKRRAQRVARAVGLKDCGCRQRQEAWNRAGYRLGIGTPPPPDSGPTG